MGRFEDLLLEVKGGLKVLPIIHSCDGYGFRSILESGKIEMRYCDVFKENLVYAFYGKPAYKIHLVGATKNDALFPVCFIMNQDYLQEFWRIYPFDSGAFAKIDEIKSKYFHDKMNISDFQVRADIRNAVRIVEKFYSNNEKYVDDKPDVNVNIFRPTEYEARGYAELITSARVEGFDNRVSTIEMVYNADINLNADNLMQVIMPNSLTGDAEVVRMLGDKYGVLDPITYYIGRGHPLECHGAIYQKYREYLNAGGML
jgi:hypothetical protein